MKDAKIETLCGKTRPDEISVSPERKKFQSVTRLLLATHNKKNILCPYCGNVLNFEVAIEWMGPDAFLCGSCDRLLEMSLIHRALRDLGIE
ncbi:hypothetical protein EU528_10090 [Candidatus Thorarchaeota archaeon]|nr:MAG: hypothetical protein EU528_10090 [Candidatus Thorarchaeota archaeon]